MSAAVGTPVPMKHHPMLASTGRHGCWGWCSCGWESGTYTTVSGVHLAFGQHLLAVAPPIREKP